MLRSHFEDREAIKSIISNPLSNPVAEPNLLLAELDQRDELDLRIDPNDLPFKNMDNSLQELQEELNKEPTTKFLTNDEPVESFIGKKLHA